MGTDAAPLPDPHLSRVLLVGTWEYDDNRAFPKRQSIANNLDALRSVLTDPSLGGLPLEHCRVVRNPARPEDVEDALEKIGKEARDLLLVYLSGHGTVDLDDGLATYYYAVSRTTPGREIYSALTVKRLRQILHKSQATSKVLIVDTCHSGHMLRALLKSTLAGSPEVALTESLTTFGGVMVIASTAENDVAKSLPGERLTAFTQELVTLLQSGIPGGPPVVPLDELFDRLRSRLVAKGMPEPFQVNSDTVSKRGLLRNAAAGTPVESTSGPPVARDAAVKFPRRVGPARLLLFLASVAVAVGALWVFSDYGRTQTVAPWQFMIVLAVGAASCGLVAIRLPDRYTLSMDETTIRLNVNRKPYLLYWTLVSQVKLESLGPGRFCVPVRLMPGALLDMATGWRQGPRWVEPGVVRLADLHRLAVGPVEVDDALRRFGGTAWVRSPEVDALRTATAEAAPTDERFATKTKRGWLSIAAALVLLVALSPLIGLAAEPTPMQAVCLVLVSVIWLAPGLALARIAWHPAKLAIDRAGFTFRRGQTDTRLRWSDVQDIGVLGWRRGNWVLPILCVRAPGRSFATFWNRKLGLPPDVLGCDLLALGTTTARMSAVLPRYAESIWSPDWIPATHAEGPSQADEPTAISGRAMSARTVSVGVAALAATATMISVYTAPNPQDGRFTIGVLIMVVTLYVATGLSVLLARSRCTLNAGGDAVSVTVGRRTQCIEWQHISHAWIAQHDTVTRTKRDGEKMRTVYLVELELTEDAPLPRAWHFSPCFRRSSGVIVLCPLDARTFTLNASVDTVEATLVSHAGPERWKPRRYVRH